MPEQTPITTTDPVELATRAERERIATITSMTTRHGLDALGRELVAQAVPLDAARARILDALVTRSDSMPPLNRGGSGGRIDALAGNDYTDDFRRASVDALLIRSGIKVEKPHAAARDMSTSVFDLARTSLSREGKSSDGLRGPELLKRASMTTSDFPAILAGALHASIRSGYENEPASHRAWVSQQLVPDFRSQQRPILGSAPALAEVVEGGEYTNGALDDDAASYSVTKYGRVVSLSWETLVNDNLSAFLRIQPALGSAARRKEADVVYALFAQNAAAGPTMQDSVALFHATHANLVASAAFDAAQLGLARSLLRKQTALGGGYLSLVPRFLIVPCEKEQAAEVLLANASRKTASEKAAPEWLASLQLVVEPRLPATGVYLAADSSQIDTCELGLLDADGGGPVIEEDQNFRIDERSWKVRHVFGAKFLDWRGLVKAVVT